MKLIMAVLFLFAALSSVLAQSAGSQTVTSNSVDGSGTRISGKVIDGDGAVISEVEIVAIASDGTTYRTTSNSKGRFDLEVPVGKY